MSNSSWRLDRRTFLRSAGVALALPLLDCMGWAEEPAKSTSRPRRLCSIFFPFGVCLPPENHAEYKNWNWFPLNEGRDYRLTQTLDPLEPFRSEISILGGLSHPKGRSVHGHDISPIFLTGGDPRNSTFSNSISIDQQAAETLGWQTRMPSLALSSMGGIGIRAKPHTLSFNRRGDPIPSESSLRLIFNRLFSDSQGANRLESARRLDHQRRVVDVVLDQAKDLRRQLGPADQRKIDEYLQSVNEIEGRLERSAAWQDKPRDPVSADGLDLDAHLETPEQYVRTMYDLIALAFRTDTTRYITYMIHAETETNLANSFPKLVLDPKSVGHHDLSHIRDPTGYVMFGRYDRWLTQQLAYFLGKLRDTNDGDGSLLDLTMVLYGSGCSTLHNPNNYPLVLAGGSKMGLKHGAYHRFSADVPCANLFVTMLDRLGTPVGRFADSTGGLPQLV